MERIGAGRNHTLIVNDDGSLWACGDNSHSQLGKKPSLFDCRQAKLKKVKGIPGIRAVCSGRLASFFIDNEDCVWVCGENTYGQLGVNKRANRVDCPTKLKNIPGACSVVSYYRHSLLLDEEGNVWSTGENERGQLGLGDNVKRLCPEKIEGLPPIKSISCGSHFSMFLDFNGNVWYAGDIKMKTNQYRCNKPALISGLESIRQTFSGSFHSVCINEKGQVISFGQMNGVCKDIEIHDIDLPPMVNASITYSRSLFIDHQGTLWGIGRDVFNDFPSGLSKFSYAPTEHRMEESIAPFIALSSGFSHTILVSSDGSVYTTGNNEKGALGLGSIKSPVCKLNKIPNLSVLEDAVHTTKSARNV